MTNARTVAVTFLLALGAAAAGFVLGRQAAPPDQDPAGAAAAAAGPAEVPAPQAFTCSMHPQVRLPGAGSCPICEMPLIPAASATGGATGPPTLQLSAHAAAMAGVETVAVERRELVRDLRAVGKVQFDESSLATITPRVDGYAERLFVNFTGVAIRKGDHLAEVYSPELLVAQRELLIALQGGATGALVDTAKQKLLLLGLTADQVAHLVDGQDLAERITLHSPISGTVIEKLVVEKAAFRAGEPLYRIANLEKVWVYVDVYEYDLPWIRYGQRVSITAEALPGQTFTGMVTFVQPVVSEETRTIRVPVHVPNVPPRLKPGMFVSAVLHGALGPAGEAVPTGVEGKFTCPMHPEVLQDAAGSCSVCEMPLEQIPGEPPPPDQARPPAAPKWQCPMQCEGDKTYDQLGKCPDCKMALEQLAPPAAGKGTLAVPLSAVLDSGTRRLVYVEKQQGLYEPREVTLGPRAGAFYAVLSGLAAGERVVARGNFLIDSQFQVTGHPSLLYPGGLHAAPDAPPQPGEHREQKR
jgi:Cu(I)/Ag(I) efflux system membrane fusion protein